jgi:hypothetical protein
MPAIDASSAGDISQFKGSLDGEKGMLNELLRQE